MNTIMQNRVFVYVKSLLLILQFVWVNDFKASEELSETVETLRTSRVVGWHNELSCDERLSHDELVESFGISRQDISVQPLSKSDYPKPSSVKNLSYRNMHENSDLMRVAMARQYVKLEQFRFQSRKLREKTLFEIEQEEKRQRVIALIVRQNVSRPQVQNKIVAKVEDIVFVDGYAQVLLNLCESLNIL